MLALRRAASLGNGWHGIRLTPEELRGKRTALQQLCQEAGRRPDEVTVSLRLTLEVGEAKTTAGGQRLPLTGTLTQIADDLSQYEAAGLEYLVLSVASPDTASTISTIERLAKEIL